jgi:hypothetical protein
LNWPIHVSYKIQASDLYRRCSKVDTRNCNAVRQNCLQYRTVSMDFFLFIFTPTLHIFTNNYNLLNSKIWEGLINSQTQSPSILMN